MCSLTAVPLDLGSGLHKNTIFREKKIILSENVSGDSLLPSDPFLQMITDKLNIFRGRE